MILIKFASRGRADWFRRGIANIVNTIHTEDYRILVTADLDDTEMNNQHIIGFCGAHDNVSIVHGNSESKVHAINRDMEFLDDFPWTILVNFSDDMFFTVNGWDNILKHHIKRVWGTSLDFFAHFNDGYAKEALATMSIIGRDYYNRDKYIYHPSYKSFSCDAEAMFVAQMRGRHHYFEESIFLHQHPSNSPRRGDETYRINSLATPHDTKNYFERLNRYFDEPVTSETFIPFKEHLGRIV